MKRAHFILAAAMLFVCRPPAFGDIWHDQDVDTTDAEHSHTTSPENALFKATELPGGFGVLGGSDYLRPSTAAFNAPRAPQIGNLFQRPTPESAETELQPANPGSRSLTSPARLAAGVPAARNSGERFLVGASAGAALSIYSGKKGLQDKTAGSFTGGVHAAFRVKKFFIQGEAVFLANLESYDVSGVHIFRPPSLLLPILVKYDLLNSASRFNVRPYLGPFFTIPLGEPALTASGSPVKISFAPVGVMAGVSAGLRTATSGGLNGNVFADLRCALDFGDATVDLSAIPGGSSRTPLWYRSFLTLSLGYEWIL